jgi:hypothetical protein
METEEQIFQEGEIVTFKYGITNSFYKVTKVTKVNDFYRYWVVPYASAAYSVYKKTTLKPRMTRAYALTSAQEHLDKQMAELEEKREKIMKFSDVLFNERNKEKTNEKQ